MVKFEWLKTNVTNIIMDGISNGDSFSSFIEEQKNRIGGSNKGRPPGVTGNNAQLPDSDLEVIATKNGQIYKLTKEAAQGYKVLKQAASEAGYDLDAALRSAYRDWNKQDDLYKHQSKFPAAKPGTSNHGWGRAIDISTSSKIYSWMKKNAFKYNWYWFGPDDEIHFTYGYNESGHPGHE